MKKESGNGARHFHYNDWREMLALVNSSNKISVNNYSMQTDKVKTITLLIFMTKYDLKKSDLKLNN